MNDVLVSVVIANYNYGRFLEGAIKSVIAQNMGDKVELIICDGGSTDNSVEIIKRYADGLPPGTPLVTNKQTQTTKITWWCSEKDRGQSHAFNKGFAHARGRFLTWLNADDVMAQGAIVKLTHAVARHPECEWFIGGCCWLDPELNILLCTRARPLSKIRASGSDIQVYGPSSFFSRGLFERVGGCVDEEFHYKMDTELWNRFYHKGKASYCVLHGYIWGFRMHPAAKTSGYRFKGSALADPNNPAWEKQRREREMLLTRYCSKAMTPWRRFISVSWRLWACGKIDTLRLKGKPFV